MRKLTASRFILLAFVGIAAFSLGAKHVQACTNPTTIPANFAAPCPAFSVAPTSTTANGVINITATGNATRYVDQQVYIYNGSSWIAANLQGAFTAQGYTTSTATYAITQGQLSQLPSGTVYLAEWDWTWNSSLSCFVGPSGSSCNQGSWRVQEFSLSGSSGTGGGGVAPTTYPDSRTDLCETPSSPDPGGPPCTNLGLSFLGRNYTDANGVYHPVDVAPNVGGLLGAHSSSTAGGCITDPDFGTKICRVTDYSMGAGFSAGAAAGGTWASDSSAFFVFTYGEAPRLYAFSDDSNMVSTPTDIGGTSAHGSATTFASAALTFSTTNPDVIYELSYGYNKAGNDNPYVVLNQVTINENGGAAGASGWTLSRTQLFNFEESNGNCLPSNFLPNWTGTMNVSADGTQFLVALGDNGQNGIANASHTYGATFVASYTMGKPNNAGCRVVNTNGVNGRGVGPMMITGDWGDVGPALDGSGNLPLGVSGGNILPDTLYLHNGGPIPDNHYGYFNGSAIVTSTIQSCLYNNKPSPCEEYFWEIATRNVRPSEQITGHATTGYLNLYQGKQYASVNYHNPNGSHSPLLTANIPVDQHGSYNNADSLDQQPVFFVTTGFCDTTTATSTRCPTQYTGPLYNEIIAVENQAANGSAAQHCNYGDGSTACIYRVAHTFNTGTHWNFYTQNSEGNISPTGKFFLFASDWNDSLGCTNGVSSTNCVDNITASTKNYCVLNYTSAPCYRGDVFVAEVQ